MIAAVQHDQVLVRSAYGLKWDLTSGGRLLQVTRRAVLGSGEVEDRRGDPTQRLFRRLIAWRVGAIDNRRIDARVAKSIRAPARRRCPTATSVVSAP